MSKVLQAHLALLIVNIIYGANYSIAKEVMPAYVQPFAFVLIRVGGALVLFWLVSTLFIKEKVDKKDLPRLALLGVFGVACNQLLFLKYNPFFLIWLQVILLCMMILQMRRQKLSWKVVNRYKKLRGTHSSGILPTHLPFTGIKTCILT